MTVHFRQKGLFIVLVLLSGISTSFAQTKDTLSSAQTMVKPQRVESNETLNKDYFEQKFTGHWGGIYLGFNNLIKTDYNNYNDADKGFLSNKVLKSSSIYINAVQFSMGLQEYRNTIGMVTGIGLESQNIRFDPSVSIVENSDKHVEPVKIVAQKNLKSKLTVFYLTVPFLMEFQIPVRNDYDRIYFSVGVVEKLKLSAYTKEKFVADNNKKIIIKSPGEFGLNSFRNSLCANIGYRGIQIFAEYGLDSMFDENRGPKTIPVSFGIALFKWN
ncbi:MAG: hypothetical protein Q8859_09120 [Bacteroidota bacterium]|nr:hypothetical protein [Bacteroidota bacterium]